MIRKALGLLLLWGLIAVTAVGCGSSGSSSSTAATSTSSLSPEPRAQLAAEGAILASRPNVEAPPGLPPKKLVVKELQKGTGTEAQKGDKVKIQYYGVDWRNSAEHANSWRYEHIPVFELGSHRLLRGLNMAIRGMREGGGREVIIPYNLVYYPGGDHRQLGPLDALIYKVYLVKVLGK